MTQMTSTARGKSLPMVETTRNGSSNELSVIVQWTDN